ncbi:Mitochondrial chaperone Frataxin [Peltigera leucophlebia]|nr:Mitochondrial chaperone Frataxin [Peltigera leucophlebia]
MSSRSLCSHLAKLSRPAQLVPKSTASPHSKAFKLLSTKPPSSTIPLSCSCRKFSICHNQNQTQLLSSPQFNLRLNSSIFPKYHLSNSQPYSSSPTTSSPTASQISPSDSELSIEEYHSLSNRYIDNLVAIFEQLQEERADVDCEYSAGVLTLYFPPHGTYVLNKQPPNKQIWLSSPVSGPKRYDFIKIKGARAGDWVYARDGSRLSELLERELGVDVGVVEEGDW